MRRTMRSRAAASAAILTLLLLACGPLQTTAHDSAGQESKFYPQSNMDEGVALYDFLCGYAGRYAYYDKATASVKEIAVSNRPRWAVPLFDGEVIRVRNCRIQGPYTQDEWHHPKLVSYREKVNREFQTNPLKFNNRVHGKR